MLHHIRRPIFTSILCAAALGAHAVNASVLSDDFDGETPIWPTNPTWRFGGTTGNSKATFDGASHVAIEVGWHANFNRAVLVSRASNFDPFTAPLRIELDGISLNQPKPEAGGRTSGYVLLGRTSQADDTSANKYFPGNSEINTAIAVMVRSTDTGAYDLRVLEFIGGSYHEGQGGGGESLYALSGAPTSLVLEVDGTGKSLKLSVGGATFTGNGTGTMVRALSSGFTLENMGLNGDLFSRIAIGAFNDGAVGYNIADPPLGPPEYSSRFVIDSINVSVVPEPATAALLGAGLLLGARRKR